MEDFFQASDIRQFHLILHMSVRSLRSLVWSQKVTEVAEAGGSDIRNFGQNFPQKNPQFNHYQDLK